MNFLDLARERYSLRNYSPQPIEREKLEYVLQAAQLAPSAANCQPWSFIVIRNSQLMARILECYHRDWFKTAHTCIVVVGDHEQSWKRKDGKDHCDIDAAIAADHITLAAAEQGLGTVWVCNFDEEKVRKVLELTEDQEVVAIIPIGYPGEGNEIPEKKRKNFNEIVRWID